MIVYCIPCIGVLVVASVTCHNDDDGEDHGSRITQANTAVRIKFLNWTPDRR